MKKNILIMLCFVIAYTTGTVHGNNTSPTDSIEYLNEDSLIAILYPPVTLHYMDSATIENLKSIYGISDKKKTQRRTLSAPTINNNIDQSNYVGEIPIMSGMSQTGARTYEIPIDVPTGINNLTPNLSLTYNSQQSESSMGVGWTLSGLPYIARCPRDMYHDGYVRGISLKDNECFSLSGQRLIKTHSTWNATWFETETGHVKVKCSLNGGEIPNFEVFYPDGTKGYFNYIPIDNEGTMEPWPENNVYFPMTSMQDLHGNTIEYDYFRRDLPHYGN